jgi:hypothetical protein
MIALSRSLTKEEIHERYDVFRSMSQIEVVKTALDFVTRRLVQCN